MYFFKLYFSLVIEFIFFEKGMWLIFKLLLVDDNNYYENDIY